MWEMGNKLIVAPTLFLIVLLLLVSSAPKLTRSARQEQHDDHDTNYYHHPPQPRQFSPGTSGIGEVINVAPHEFEELARQHNNASSSTTNTPIGANYSDSGGPVVIDKRLGVVVDHGLSHEGVRGTTTNAMQQQHNKWPDSAPVADRRKVVNKDGGGGGGHNGDPDDLSFSGIINGLLDTFMTPQQQQQQQQHHGYGESTRVRTTTTTTTTPAAPSIEDDEADEEEEESLHFPRTSETTSTTATTAEEEDEEENVSVDEDQENVSPDLSDMTSQEPNGTAEDTNPRPETNKVARQCAGECRNIIFGLFLCDEIDNEADCPEPGLACCVNNEPEFPNDRYKNPYGNGTSSEEVILDNDHDQGEEEEEQEPNQDTSSSEQPMPIHQQPPHRHQIQRPQPPPPPPLRYTPPPVPPYHPQRPHYYPYPPVHPPRMPGPPACMRYCVKNYLEQYCSEKLQSLCGVDGFCCNHEVNEVLIKDEEEADEEKQENNNNNNNNNNNQGDYDSEKEVSDSNSSNSKNSTANKILGPCTEDVGSCVSTNIINIICFGHATPTELYTCPRSNSKCCARKTALPKESLPQTTPAPAKDVNSRNMSSSPYTPNKPMFPPPPPPPPQMYQPGGSVFPIQTVPTSLPIAETPPPPPGSTQFENPFEQPRNPSTPPRQPIGSYVCGVKGVPTVAKKRRRKRVVGGSDSLPGEWCWQVALINSLNQYLCGGALIGTRWVLTAAHCVTNIVRSGDAIYVRVGDHDLTSRYGSPGAQTLRVATTYIHHNHNSQTLDNDIALLKLQGNAALKEGVCLVCLPSRNPMSEVPGKRCTVTGYGYMGESGPIPLRIREATLPIVSEDECVRKVNAVTEKVFALPMSSFCAGGELRNDACQGDGGGPLVCRADDPSTGDPGTGYYELTGLVSWGFGCGRENVPGVYVKVSSFIGWIHQIIRSN